MNNTNNYFDHLIKIFNYTKAKEVKEYLNNIKLNYYKLDKKQRKKYLERLNELSYINSISDFFKPKEKYQIYYKNEAFKKLILDYFSIINIENFDNIIDDLLEFLNPVIDVHETKRITKKDIDLIFKTIIKKMPEFENILEKITLNILILNNSHKYVNSATTHSKNFEYFMIFCFYMKNNEEYKEGRINPIYVFLHELGHIICWIATKKSREVPKSFFEDIGGDYFEGLTPDNPDALEVFADCFAMMIMYNTPLNCYNPFSNFFEELFIDLEKYFSKIIKELQ